MANDIQKYEDVCYRCGEKTLVFGKVSNKSVCEKCYPTLAKDMFTYLAQNVEDLKNRYAEMNTGISMIELRLNKACSFLEQLECQLATNTSGEKPREKVIIQDKRPLKNNAD